MILSCKLRNKLSQHFLHWACSSHKWSRYTEYSFEGNQERWDWEMFLSMVQEGLFFVLFPLFHCKIFFFFFWQSCVVSKGMVLALRTQQWCCRWQHQTFSPFSLEKLFLQATLLECSDLPSSGTLFLKWHHQHSSAWGYAEDRGPCLVHLKSQFLNEAQCLYFKWCPIIPQFHM